MRFDSLQLLKASQLHTPRLNDVRFNLPTTPQSSSLSVDRGDRFEVSSSQLQIYGKQEWSQGSGSRNGAGCGPSHDGSSGGYGPGYDGKTSGGYGPGYDGKTSGGYGPGYDGKSTFPGFGPNPFAPSPPPPHPGNQPIQESLTTGQPRTFVNNNGKSFQVSVQRGESSAQQDSYTVTVGRDQVTVKVPRGTDATDILRRVTDYYSQQPENMRRAVKTVEVKNERNPSDADWERRYNMPGFTSAATGGGGNITIWNGQGNLTEENFDHEFGHNVGEATRDRQDSEAGPLGRLWNRAVDFVTRENEGEHVPRGYRRRVQGETPISEYGKAAPAEDFADSYQEYQEAVEQGPAALEQFRRRYPERVAVIEREVLNRRLDVVA